MICNSTSENDNFRIILLIKYDLIFSVLKYFRNRPINIAELKDNIKCQRFCGAENPLNN